VPHRLLSHQGDAEHVDAELLGEELRFDRTQRPHPENPRIVDQDVDAPEDLDHGCNQRLHRRRVGDGAGHARARESIFQPKLDLLVDLDPRSTEPRQLLFLRSIVPCRVLD
jgi:hypothetical protein